MQVPQERVHLRTIGNHHVSSILCPARSKAYHDQLGHPYHQEALLGQRQGDLPCLPEVRLQRKRLSELDFLKMVR